MTIAPDLTLARAVLAAHLAVIAFNVAGLVVIPLGSWLKWRFVRLPWLRGLHLASMAIVAVQAVAGRACFLTLLEDHLTGRAPAGPPLIMGFINRLIFWPLPLWVFTALYLAVFLYVVALLWLVPPNERHRRAPSRRPIERRR
jgi:hypothetical protein